MAHFTQNMRQRLFAQGWEFSHGYYDYVMGKKTIYSNKSFPGVYIMETGTRNFAIYSDKLYKTENEKIQEVYEQGLANGEMKGFNRGFLLGLKHGIENTNKTERLSNKSV